MKTRHSKQVLVGLSVFSDGVLHFLQIKKKFYLFYQNYLVALKLLKSKENNKKICDIFYHNFKNIPCYVMSEVPLKTFYFALSDDRLTLKTLVL